MGTADLAAVSLAALADSGLVDLLAVVSQPDRPKGRDLKLAPTPVKTEALRRNLPVLQPDRARNPEFIEELKRLAPELIVVAAYGQILPASILEIPRHGCVNIHTSLLPKYRGAAPIQWAILNGESETGVTIMKMDEGCDTGPMLAREVTAITPEDDGKSLHDRLAKLGADLLLRTLPGYVDGKILPTPQPTEGASHARKIVKDDGLLDWRKPARTLWNQVRGLHPWPGAFTHIHSTPKPILLKIRRAEPVENHTGTTAHVLESNANGILVGCGAGSLRILELQREGGRSLLAGEFLRGHPLPEGTVFAPQR